MKNGMIESQERRCPNCNAELSLKQLVLMMHPKGQPQYLLVRNENGVEEYVEAGLINTTKMEILEDEPTRKDS